MDYYKLYLKENKLKHELKIINKSREDIINYYNNNIALNLKHFRLRNIFLKTKKGNIQKGGENNPYIELYNLFKGIGISTVHYGLYKTNENDKEKNPRITKIKEEFDKLYKLSYEIKLLFKLIKENTRLPIYKLMDIDYTDLSQLKVKNKTNRYMKLREILEYITDFDLNDIFKKMKSKSIDTLMLLFMNNDITLFNEIVEKLYNIHFIIIRKVEPFDFENNLELREDNILEENFSDFNNIDFDKMPKKLEEKLEDYYNKNLYSNELISCKMKKFSGYYYILLEKNNSYLLLEINGNIKYKYDELPKELMNIYNKECIK